MPNIKSAKKRLKQSKVRRDRNRALRTVIRNRCKKFLKTVTTGEVKDAEASFVDAVRILDKMGAKKIIHKNVAARKKSRLSARLKKMKAGNASS